MNGNTRSRELLARLIAFPSVSLQPNLDLIHFVRDLLAAHGIESTIVADESGTRANLFASVGPAAQPGVMLSGHSDVVPVEGQAWSLPPFELTEREGRLYGRGSADMKGFVACALNALIEARDASLAQPLQLALSYDEEIGCVGVRRLIDVLEQAPVRPFLCLVGEPTSMRIAIGHKGKTALRAVCHGQEAHSALAPLFANAVHLGVDLVGAIRGIQQRQQREGAQDDGYEVGCSTLHVGRFQGGRTLNIVPNRCEIDFEIRNIAADDPERLIDELRAAASAIVERARQLSDVAAIEIETVNSYPGLDTSPADAAVAFLQAFVPADPRPVKVAFGSEGGLFANRLGVPALVCGPGSIAVAHKPDEYVEASQLALCDDFLRRLIGRLSV